jgi:hypothetical protein
MVKLRKNKTFRKNKLYRNKNKKNNTKKLLKGGSNNFKKLQETLQKIQNMKPIPKIKIEIINKIFPKSHLILNNLNKNITPITMPNIIGLSTYTFDYSVKNIVKIKNSSEISNYAKLDHTYTIILDENNENNIIKSINIDEDFTFPKNSIVKYSNEFSAEEYQIKIYYLQEIKEELLEGLLKEKNMIDDVQKIIFEFVGNEDRINIL